MKLYLSFDWIIGAGVHRVCNSVFERLKIGHQHTVCNSLFRHPKKGNSTRCAIQWYPKNAKKGPKSAETGSACNLGPDVQIYLIFSGTLTCLPCSVLRNKKF